MADKFDPYHQWLGIPPRDQPANYYRLLSVQLFESDPRVIDAAARRLAIYVKSCAAGPHQAEAKKLLSEIVAARTTLHDPQQRAAYDRLLASPPPGVPSGAASQALPASDADPAALPQPPPAPPEPDWGAPLSTPDLQAPPLAPEAADTVVDSPLGITTAPDFSRKPKSKKSGAYKTVKAVKNGSGKQQIPPGKTPKSRQRKQKLVWIAGLGAVGVVALIGIAVLVFSSSKTESSAGDSAQKLADSGPSQPSASAPAVEPAAEAASADEPESTDYEEDAGSDDKPAVAAAPGTRAGGGSAAKLIEAIESGASLAAVQQLLSAGADLAAKDKQGRTPLRWAVIKKRADLVKALLAKKANPNAPDSWGETPLMSAARSGNEAILKLLLEAGADPNDKTDVRSAAGKRVDDEP